MSKQRVQEGTREWTKTALKKYIKEIGEADSDLRELED